MNILIVEPSKSINAMISGILADFRVNIKTAASIKHAKAQINSSLEIDIVIVESVLEDGQAYPLIQYLRHAKATENSPIYLLSSDGDVDYNEALSTGVTEVFPKNKAADFAEFLLKKVQYIENSSKISGHILYVEDSLSESLVVEDYLTHKGFSVVAYTSAEEAFKEFEKKTFDLVLTDLFLAGKMTGLNLLRKIRAHTSEKNLIPVVVTSSDQDKTRKLELLNAGANDFVAKPVFQEELIARVSNLVVIKKLQDQVRQQKKELELIAMTDQLTGLFNRNYLFNNVPKKISEAFRHGWDCALVVIDVDHFKSVNDTHGHATGDIILKAVAQVLIDSCRKEDIVARFGGEEFIMMLAHCNHEEGLVKAENLRQRIETLFPENQAISASFGVTSLSDVAEESANFDSLFRLADAAVYRAKDRGRNQVVGSRDMNKE